MTDKSWLYSSSADELAAELEVVEAELAALKELVREINDTVDRFGIVVLRPQLRKILSRPEVKAIMEGE